MKADISYSSTRRNNNASSAITETLHAGREGCALIRTTLCQQLGASWEGAASPCTQQATGRLQQGSMGCKTGSQKNEPTVWPWVW